eukprot:scaffold158587_cov36-Tisochrysis_lutea.AAC.3
MATSQAPAPEEQLASSPPTSYTVVVRQTTERYAKLKLCEMAMHGSPNRHIQESTNKLTWAGDRGSVLSPSPLCSFV